MNIRPSTSAAVEAARSTAAAAPSPPAPGGDDVQLRQAFNSFVGQAFFGQLLQAMRKTVGQPAYFHGGRAEEIFQQQLDQILGEKLAERSGKTFSEPMFALFKLSRR